MRCLLVLLLIGTVTAVDLNFYNGVFNDPYTNDNTLLKIWVDTACTDGLAVQVTIPSGGVLDQYSANPPGNAKFVTGLDFGPSAVPSVETDGLNGNAPKSATIHIHFTPAGNAAIGDGGAVWTFTNFGDIHTLSPSGALDAQQHAGFINNGFYLQVDVLNSNFVGVSTNRAITLSSANNPGLFKVTQSERCGGDQPTCPPGGCGDPVFSGFQGQNYQFHGLPDEHFNLVSSPDVELNAHFVYLSAGKCDYNDTECWTHPGTYMDVLGFSIGESHVKLVAGTHESGMRVWFNEHELKRGTKLSALSTNVTASLRYHQNGRINIHTEIMNFEIINSDMFFNIRAGLNDGELLHVGATKHTVTDKNICKTNSETSDYKLVETTVAKKYPVTTPLHGLIGQTWRNVKVCGRDWMGTVQDYLVSDLFATDGHYSYFQH